MKFIIFYDRKKEFRWKLLGRNNRTIAVAGEGFTTKANCKKSIFKLEDIACVAATYDIEDKTIKSKKKK